MVLSEKKDLRVLLSQHSRSRGFPLFTQGSDINTVMFGEWHKKYDRLHSAWIRMIKPEKVLLEHLGGFIYDPRENKLSLQPNRIITSETDLVMDMITSTSEQMVSGIKPVTDACAAVGAIMIGCDMTPTEMIEWMKSRGLNSNNPQDRFELSYHRDTVMYPIIAANQGAAHRRSVVIIGSNHARGVHSINLERKEITDYAYVENM